MNFEFYFLFKTIGSLYLQVVQIKVNSNTHRKDYRHRTIFTKESLLALVSYRKLRSEYPQRRVAMVRILKSETHGWRYLPIFASLSVTEITRISSRPESSSCPSGVLMIICSEKCSSSFSFLLGMADITISQPQARI